jgi:hypothetical protein
MKSIKLIPIAATILITFYSCNSNKKLNQKNAEKVIKEFISTHSVNSIPGREDCNFNLQSIAQFAPVSQFSEREATITIYLKCTQFDNLDLTFMFQKNIDNHWILMKINGGEYNNGVINNLIAPNQNINMIAQ